MPNFDAFISYNSSDRDEVLWIADDLKRRGINAFLDRDGLVAGQDWRAHITALLPQVPSVIICIGRHGLGQEQSWEIDSVLNMWRTSGHRLSIIPLFLRDANADPKRIGQLANFTWIEIGDRGAQAMETLVGAIRGVAPGPVGRTADPRMNQSPFMGLRAFEEADAGLFFGREELTTALLAKVTTNRFVAVVGASGSGKSSLVNAGLAPRLKNPADGRGWVVVRMRPDRNPMRSLAAALVAASRRDALPHELLREQEQLHADLSRSDQGGTHVAAVLATLSERNNNAPVLIFVDQYEELFTLGDEPVAGHGVGSAASPRDQFIDALVGIVSNQAAPLHVIVTLRADQFHHVTQDARLNSLFSVAQVNVGQMTREELRRAMEEPARRARLVFEPGLVDTILDDMHDQEHALPLLEFVLDRLWLERDEQRRMLTRTAYERSGRISHAIAQHADEVLASLGEADQAHARDLLTALVRLGQGGADSRRPVALRDLKPELLKVAERLAGKQSRLLSIDGQKVEIAHEALIREWSRLKAWLQTERKHLILAQHLESGAQQWEQARTGAGRADEGLLDPGWPLQEAQELALDKPLLLSELSQAYVKASVDNAEQIKKKEAKAKAREEANRRRSQRQWLTAASVAAAFLGVVAVGAGAAYIHELGLKDQVAKGYGTAIDSSNRLVNDVATRLGQTDRVPPAAVATVLRHARSLIEDVSKELAGSSSERRIGQLPKLTLVDIIANEAETYLARGAWAEFTASITSAREQLEEPCREASATARQCEIRRGRLGLLEAKLQLMLSEAYPRVTKDGKHLSLKQIRQAGETARTVETTVAGLLADGGNPTTKAASVQTAGRPAGQVERETRDLILIAARASAIEAQTKQKEAILDEVKRVDMHKEAEQLLGKCVARVRPVAQADPSDADAAFMFSDCHRMLGFSQAALKNTDVAKRSLAEAIQRIDEISKLSPGNVALSQARAEAEIIAGWLELPAGRVAPAPKELVEGLRRYTDLIKDNTEQFSLRDRYIYVTRVLFKESAGQLDEETKLAILSNRTNYLAERLKAKASLTVAERELRLADLLDSLQDYYTLHSVARRYEDVVRNYEQMKPVIAAALADTPLAEGSLAHLLEVYYWVGGAARETRDESDAMEAFKAIHSRVSKVIDDSGKDYATFEKSPQFLTQRYFYAWAVGQIGRLRIDNIRDDQTLDRLLDEGKTIVMEAYRRRPGNIEFKIANANILVRIGRRHEIKGEADPALVSYREAAGLGSSDAIRLLRDRFLKNALARAKDALADEQTTAELERLRVEVTPVPVAVSGKSDILPDARTFTAFLVPTRVSSDPVGTEVERLKLYYGATLDQSSIANLRSILDRAAKRTDFNSRDLRHAKDEIDRNERKKNIFGSTVLAKALGDADYGILNNDLGRALQSLDLARQQLEDRIKTSGPTPDATFDWGLLAIHYLRLSLVARQANTGSVVDKARAGSEEALSQALGSVPADEMRTDIKRSPTSRRQILRRADIFYDLVDQRLMPVINRAEGKERFIYVGNQSFTERFNQVYDEFARKGIALYYAVQDSSDIERRAGQRIIELEQGRAFALLQNAGFWTRPVNAERARQENPRQRAMDAFQDARSLLTQLVKKGGTDGDLDKLEVKLLMNMADAHSSMPEEDAAVRLANQAVDKAKRSVERNRGDLTLRQHYAEALEKLGGLTKARGDTYLKDANTIYESSGRPPELNNLVLGFIKRSEEEYGVARQSYELAVGERAIILQLDLSRMDAMCVCQVATNINNVADLIEETAKLKSLRDRKREKENRKEAFDEIDIFLTEAIDKWRKIEGRQAANATEIDDDTALLKLYQARAKDIRAAKRIEAGNKDTSSHEASIKDMEETTKLMKQIADQQPADFLWEYSNTLSNLGYSYLMTGDTVRAKERIDESNAVMAGYYFNIGNRDPRNIKVNFAHAALLNGDTPEAERRYRFVERSSTWFTLWRQQLVGDLRQLKTVPAYSGRIPVIDRIIDEYLRM